MFHATMQASKLPTYPISQWLLMVPLGPLRAPETLLENLQSQNYFHKNTKVSFAFSLSLSYMYSGIFQRLQDMRCHKRLKAEAGM